MYQKLATNDQSEPYRGVAFSDRFKRWASSAGKPASSVRTASRLEALVAADHARQSMDGLACNAVVARLQAHNPQIFQLIEHEEKRSAAHHFVALLPLNALGLDSLLRDRFSVLDPDVDSVCREGETPVAIYVWLMFAPSAFVPAIRALEPFLAKLAPSGCPIFARSRGERAARLFAGSGFMPAAVHYPDAPVTLLVVPCSPLDRLALSAAKPVRSSDIRIRLARTVDDLMKGFAIRAATYISEQQCPYEEEYDGNDFCASHFIGEIDGEPAGCLRMRFFSGFVKVERLAVRHEYRKSKLAFRLVREALGYAGKKGYRLAYGHSRTDLTPFWGLFGFRPVADRVPFIFSDVEYVELQADLDAAEGAIAIGVDPYVLIRPEGEWDRPGPLDRSVRRGSRSIANGGRTRGV